MQHGLYFLAVYFWFILLDFGKDKEALKTPDFPVGPAAEASSCIHIPGMIDTAASLNS